MEKEWWALMKVDPETKDDDYHDGEVEYQTKGRNKEFYGYYHPDDIHEGRQALLEAVLKGPMKGCLKYGAAVKGDVYIHIGCLGLQKSFGAELSSHKNIRLIFTPPAEEQDDSIDGLLEQLKKETCMSESAIKLVKRIFEAKDAKP